MGWENLHARSLRAGAQRSFRRISGRKHAGLVAVVLGVALLGLAPVPANASLDRTAFELDKDASNDTITTFHGVLNAALGTTGTSISMQVCQVSTASAVGFTLLIDAEQFSVTAASTANGGGCPSRAPNKRNYTATRAFGGTTAGTHSKGEDVSRLVTGAFDGDDWDGVYAQWLADNDTTCEDLGAAECSFVHDGRAESIFTSSKDYDVITSWQWRDSSVPEADELDDGFAAKYVSGADQNLYFGADRAATNGAKDAGFWFFHKSVTPVPGVGSADGTFIGEHTAPDPGDNGVFCFGSEDFPLGSSTPNCAPYDADDTGGDVLILTTFTEGGDTVTVRLFEWVGPGGSSASLKQIDAFGDCVPGATGQEVCATVNNTTVESPWPYDGKQQPVHDQIGSGGLLEGGLNLTDLGLEGCFSSFMATTRSAPSVTADPKDFILGNFEACDTEVTTTPADGTGTALVDSDEDEAPDVAIGVGSAGVDVTDQALVDVKGIDDWEGTLDFFLCGPIASGTCDAGGVKIGDTLDISGADPQPFVSESANLTSVGRYCWRGEFTSETEGVPDAVDASEGECFEVTPVTPLLSTTSVDAEGDPVGTVDFGEALYDEASLSGTANQPGDNGPGDANGAYESINATNGAEAGGTITFTLVGPDGDTTDCTTVATGSSGSNPEDVTVDDGDGDYATTGFTPDAPGDYHWKASYTGDSPNTLGASHNDDCDEANEDVTVQQIPTEIKTKQSWYPNDTATITSSVSGDLLEAGGSVVFTLYDTSDCTGAVIYTETETLTGGSNAEEVGTSNTTFAITTGYDDAAGSLAGPYSWKVVYTPAAGDTAHTGTQSACDAEHFSITYTNDPGPSNP
jgi:hypothetical protein